VTELPPFSGPLFAPLAPLLPNLSLAPALTSIQYLIADRRPYTRSGQPVSFILPPDDGLAYELRIWQNGQVATRAENWHDFFNALVWLTFPQIKGAINARHARFAVTETNGRGHARDALTHFDECGAVLVASDDSLLDLVREFRWKTLFWDRRDELRTALRCFIVGHGTYEQLRQPYHGLTAKAVLYDVAPAWMRLPLTRQLAELDRRVADDWLNDRYDQPRTLQPLPLMGFPGMTPDNESAAYYDDLRQFRPGRTPRRV